MGMSLSTLRFLAPASWALDLAAQIYGMTSTPSMLDVHNRHLSYFSPQPYFIAGFFTPQQAIQLAWLARLVALDPSSSSSSSDNPNASSSSSSELAIQADYVPVYALGNACIAAWMLLWNGGNLAGSAAAVWLNSLAQLAYLTGAVGRLAKMNTASRSSVLTHLNVKTFAGIGVLDLLHNTSAAFAKGEKASLLVKVLTGLGFGVASACADWIFGACLVFDLVSLAIGQKDYDPGWSKLLGAYAVGSAAIVGLKNWFRPPYVDERDGYKAIERQEAPDDYDGLAYGDNV